MKSFLFDYGGTLDTAATHWFYIFQQAYAKQGLNIEESTLRQAYVTGERTLAKERIVLPEDNFQTMLSKKISIQIAALEKELGSISFASDDEREALCNKLTIYCDDFARGQVQKSAETLEYLSGKYKLVMVSNFYGNLHKVLATYGILHYFDKIVESAVVGVRKPDAAIWQLGVEAAGMTATDCIAVGDSFGKDIKPAQSIGCETVWFKGKEWEDKVYDENLPTHVITELSQLRLYY